MEVVIEKVSVVKPALPTWIGNLTLSEYAQVGAMSHVPTIYFYKPSQDWHDQPQKVMNLLKNSLSQALVHFYPLAGRLHPIKGSRLFLNCNAMGVHFIEAESNSTLEDFGDFTPSPAMKNIVPSIDYTKPIEETPMMFVQVTTFKCGGLCVATCISHVIADGMSAVHFKSEWARLARGEKLDQEPVFDSKALRAGEPLLSSPPANNFFHYNYRPVVIEETGSAEESEITNVTNLKLTRNQVDILKKLANKGVVPENGRAYSRYEAITGHIWRSLCKARMHRKEQPTALQVSVDIRSRLGRQLPQTYFGNGAMEVLATSTSGELMSRPLGYAASRIRETVGMVDDKYINLGIDFFKSQKDLSSFQELHELRNDDGTFFGNPNLVVTSWLNLPIHSWDFGCGKEIHMGLPHLDFDGDVIIMPGDGEDGSVNVLACIQVRHIDAFKKYLYELDTY